MKLWVDDLREPPDTSWVIARSVGTAIELLHSGWVIELSLDHDLGDGVDGYEVARWLEEHPQFMPSVAGCHSSNPVGAARITAAFVVAFRRNQEQK